MSIYWNIFDTWESSNNWENIYFSLSLHCKSTVYNTCHIQICVNQLLLLVRLLVSCMLLRVKFLWVRSCRWIFNRMEELVFLIPNVVQGLTVYLLFTILHICTPYETRGRFFFWPARTKFHSLEVNACTRLLLKGRTVGVWRHALLHYRGITHKLQDSVLASCPVSISNISTYY